MKTVGYKDESYEECAEDHSILLRISTQSPGLHKLTQGTYLSKGGASMASNLKLTSFFTFLNTTSLLARLQSILMMSPSLKVKDLETEFHSGLEWDQLQPLLEIRQLPWQGIVQLNLQPALTIRFFRHMPTPIQPLTFLILTAVEISQKYGYPQSIKANLSPLLQFSDCVATGPCMSIFEPLNYPQLQSGLTVGSLTTANSLLISVNFFSLAIFASYSCRDVNFEFVETRQYQCRLLLEWSLFALTALRTQLQLPSSPLSINLSSSLRTSAFFLYRLPSSNLSARTVKYSAILACSLYRLYRNVSLALDNRTFAFAWTSYSYPSFSSINQSFLWSYSCKCLQRNILRGVVL